MIVHLYAPCWNEELMLPFFLRHYSSWVDRFHIFDDGSTDRSLDILSEAPNVEVHRLHKSDPTSLSLSLRDFFDREWKHSRGEADWVVTTKIDEHFYHPRARTYLEACRSEGITMIPGLGYQMITDTFPEAGELLCETRTSGVPWVQMNKLGIFNPNMIEETHFTVGRHRAAPIGIVVTPPVDTLLMLHYKYLGIEYTHSRHEACKPRQGNHDVKMGWGHKWHWDKTMLQEDMDVFRLKMVDIADPNIRHAEKHSTHLWWRKGPT